MHSSTAAPDLSHPASAPTADVRSGREELWHPGQQDRQRPPLLDPASYYPPKALYDEAFWAEPEGEVSGYWNPDCGFVEDPRLAAHNLMTAAVRHGAVFEFRASVIAIRQVGGRVRGQAGRRTRHHHAHRDQRRRIALRCTQRARRRQG
ncbi:FAD-dependent oxidoreductase [Streptomyces sioyaensis]|uniref:FAD-dependent oxidoreductase n=1 Tax=Streptomyces sioyaensis TaxID=67364 RepID=UPI0037D4E8F3